MMLHEVTAEVGAHKRRKRLGRGEASGVGKTSGRGNKGLKSRAGGGVRPLTEGGQMPLFRRLPKRGFSNVQFRTEYQIVNLDRLSKQFDSGATIDPQALKDAGLIRRAKDLVRVLARGGLDKQLTIRAHAFSQQARELIEKAGGVAEVIERKTPAEKAAEKRGRNKPAKRKPAKAAKAPAEKPVAEKPTDEQPPAQPEKPEAEKPAQEES